MAYNNKVLDSIDGRIVGVNSEKELLVNGRQVAVYNRDVNGNIIGLRGAGNVNIPIGGSTALQTLTVAQAVSGIVITAGFNSISVAALTSDAVFAITGGTFGDTLTIFTSQDATGGRALTIDGQTYTDPNNLPLPTQSFMLKLEHNGVAWMPVNQPFWS